MTNPGIFPINNITTVTLMLICAIDSLFVLQNPNLTQPTQNILVFKKQSLRPIYVIRFTMQFLLVTELLFARSSAGKKLEQLNIFKILFYFTHYLLFIMLITLTVIKHT